MLVVGTIICLQEKSKMDELAILIALLLGDKGADDSDDSGSGCGCFIWIIILIILFVSLK